jgi:sugar phosphate isomerase/epimerase
VEIAHFTLCEDPAAIGEADVREIRQALDDTGLAFVGFHAVFFRPANLHITSPDAAVRARSWDHLRRLIEIAGRLGGGNLVLGSPTQRRAVGIAPERAVGYMREHLTELAPYAQDRNAHILIEALPATDTNVINTLAEARRLIRGIDHPGIGGMFDFHNSAAEGRAWSELIEEHADIIQHVHLNELDGSHPRAGGSDFEPAFRSLVRNQYGGWVSLEIFQQPDEPGVVLAETRHFLDDMEGRLRGYWPRRSTEAENDRRRDDP